MTTSRLIAVASATDRGLASPIGAHFGRSPYFTLLRVEGDAVVGVTVVANPAAEHHLPGQIPTFVRDQGAEIVLAGGIGRRALTRFEQLGVDVASGATGTVQDAVTAWLEGRLRGATPCRKSLEHARAGHHPHHDHPRRP
ncbi:MAG: dinitrogenase iron-molybdenum cofactor biosynthesis protein [Proteobacteria bacterium]|nr:MAG: dinitrogenase iron-molybdenum cofactor biosynthesis protein [Pseudomonadota bacterium]